MSFYDKRRIQPKRNSVQYAQPTARQTNTRKKKPTRQYRLKAT